MCEKYKIRITSSKTKRQTTEVFYDYEEWTEKTHELHHSLMNNCSRTLCNYGNLFKDGFVTWGNYTYIFKDYSIAVLEYWTDED